MGSIGKVYNEFKANYWFTSVFLSIITFVLFSASILKIGSIEYYTDTFLITVAMSTLIGYEYATIKYFLSKIHPILRGLEPLLRKNQHRTSLEDLERKVQISWQFYLTIIIVILPFILLELIKILEYKKFNGPMPPYFYLWFQTSWSLALDVINHIIEYLLLFFLAVVIWIMIEVSLILNELNKKCSININVFNIKEIEGLESLRNFFQCIVSRYFIILTLFIISYEQLIEKMFSNILQNKVVIPLEVIILSLLVSMGVIIFIKAQKTTSYLINKSAKFELNEIYNKYEETYKMFEINPEINDNENKKELENLRLKLDFLEKKEMRIKAILQKGPTPETTFTFIITTLPSVLTLINEINKILNQ